MTEGGFVYLVGAGPGDAELITVRGLKYLQQAEVVVHDRLVSQQLLEEAPPWAELIDVGKAPGHHPWPQSDINALLVNSASHGKIVVRLKGGDPFIFGRGGEECQALAEAGIPFQVVPGVSSAIAAPAYAGIPLTHRDFASSFTVVTGHTCGTDSFAVDWGALAAVETLVILMGVGRLAKIAEQLVAHGRSPETPVAVISRGTTPAQEVVRGTLATIAQQAQAIQPPATIVIGQVVALGPQLAWFDPLRDGAKHIPVEQEPILATLETL